MYNNIPNFLKELKIWLCYDERKEPSKAPRDLKGNLLKNWNKQNPFTFKECCKSIKEGYNTGLGIVLKGTGLSVIDYDKVLKGVEVNDKLGYIKPTFKDKQIETRILRDINLLQSYTEISPSGTGIHIYFMSNTLLNNTNMQNNADPNKQIEIYSQNKFIRVSGEQVFYSDIEDRTDQINQIIDLYDLKTSKDIEIKYNIYSSRFNIYSDILDKLFIYKNQYNAKQVLDTMFKSKNGKYLKKLYYNELTDDEYIKIKGKMQVDTSNSGKSFTLIMYLLHFSYGDIGIIKKLFMQSPLCKDEYLQLKYAYNNKTKKYTKDKIDYCFIPKAICFYRNYTETDKKLFKRTR